MIEIDVHMIDANKYSLQELLSSPFLNDKNLEELKKYKVEQTKKEKAASMIFKNRYVGEYYLNEYGKPLSKTKYFNISHSHGLVVYVEDNNPIGIDVEKTRPVSEELKRYICLDEEYRYIKNDLDFFSIWTNKESLVKTIGTGLNGDIKNVPALPLNDERSFKGAIYYSRLLFHGPYLISITICSKEHFALNPRVIYDPIK